MTLAFIAFFAALALVFAILVVTLRQPMRSALALVAHMVSLAGIYAALGVDVVALFQVLIYVGAVMVFMVYTIMLLDDRDASYRTPYSRFALPGLVVSVLVAATLLRLLLPAEEAHALGGAPGQASSFSFATFSVAFMRHYWLHFELATVLLLAGIIAAWAVIREHR
jgi:NADH-quinone oxidoreductase subunit J